MTPDRWIAVLGVLVGVAAIAIPAIVLKATRRVDRHEAEKLRMQAEISKQAETIQTLRDTNTDLKIALGYFNHIGESVNRTLGALPIDGSGT